MLSAKENYGKILLDSRDNGPDRDEAAVIAAVGLKAIPRSSSEPRQINQSLSLTQISAIDHR